MINAEMTVGQLRQFETSGPVLKPEPQTNPNTSLLSEKKESKLGWAAYPAAPWRRYFARMIDQILATAMGYFIVGTILYSILPITAEAFLAMENPILDGILAVTFGSLLTGILVGYTGTSPGKIIFGLRVVGLNESPIGIARGLYRDFNIAFRGLGLGIPLVSLFTLIGAYKHLQAHGQTSWDAEIGCKAQHRTYTALETVGSILAAFCALSLSLYLFAL